MRSVLLLLVNVEKINKYKLTSKEKTLKLLKNVNILPVKKLN